MRRAKYQICKCQHRRKDHDPNAGPCKVCECTNFTRAPKGTVAKEE